MVEAAGSDLGRSLGRLCSGTGRVYLPDFLLALREDFKTFSHLQMLLMFALLLSFGSRAFLSQSAVEHCALNSSPLLMLTQCVRPLRSSPR